MSASPAPRPHIVVGTPCFGGNVTHYYAISALNLQAACAQRGIGVTFKMLGGESLITRARNIIVSQFLDDPTATHLLFIDADIGFAPEQVFALLAADKDVAGAVYPMKKLNWEVMIDQARNGVPDIAAASLSYVVDFLDPAKIERVTLPGAGEFARAKYIGNGFLMIRRAVFQRMASYYPDLAYNGSGLVHNAELNSGHTYAFFDGMIDPETREYLSEDYTFCRRWTGLGGEIWAYLDSQLAHVGTAPFVGNFAAMLRQFNP